MFDDVDHTLEKLLEIAFGTPLSFNVSFAIPDKNFKPTDKITLNCYLYDIRENRELRSIDPTLVRNSDGTIEKLYPPLRVKLSYCITAWSPAQPSPSVEPAVEEHKLLGQVLQKLVLYPTLPAEALQGSLVGQDPPLPTTIILPEDMKANRDFWNAVGGALRPALDFSITTSLPFDAPVKGPMMTTARLQIGPQPAVYSIGGSVRSTAAPPQPVAGAWVRVQETGQTDVADADGHFRFAALVPGAYTLAARAVGFHDASPLSITVPPQPHSSYDIQMTPL
ncbi:MAG TPA: Pvc16 family protein [Gemmataceae bacterium]|jgi:hypothetical protein